MDVFGQDRPHEECGVFGIYAPNRDVAMLTYFGLYALQHRGQESAGIVTSDGMRSHSHKGMGLVSQVFNEQNLAPLEGHVAIGHNRYSTTGGAHIRNAQPYLVETNYGTLAVAHNGNITNAMPLRQRLLERGIGLSSTADTEVLTQILAIPPEAWQEWGVEVEPGGDEWVRRIRALMQLTEGAYSLVILTRNALYVARDPYGLRPMSLGRLPEGYVVASETCALSTIGAEFVRYIERGEILRINEDGLASFEGKPPEKRALCSFEMVYFARTDSLLDGQMVHKIRQQMGVTLAKEAPAEGDVVIGVPDSAISAAIGYSYGTGIPYNEGLAKNRYIGRTFIQPDVQLRKQTVTMKFTAITSNLEGKRVILVDDSVVRGTTSQQLVKLLRNAGAKEVHLRISSPPVRHPCFMGVDMATYKELIAHQLDIPAICKEIGADSLDYLSLSGMLDSIAEAVGFRSTYCTACFSGNYPIPIPEWLFEDDRDKMLFEMSWGH